MSGYKRIITAFAILMISVAGYAHTVTGYTPSCGSGPQFSIQPLVSAVNSSSNYRWQFKNASNQWVCIVNGSNTINGFAFNVTGAVYNLTTAPGPIVFTNPNSSLNGVVIRCVISDGNGVDPCTMPSGNTWNSDASSNNLTISVSGTCANTPTCTAQITSLYFNKLDGGTDLSITDGSSFSPNQLNSMYNLEVATSGTVGSIKFTVTGPSASTVIENTAPYNSPATGGGAWTGSTGSYAVNIKAYSGTNASGTVCDDTTINFTLAYDCSCTESTSNLLVNGSFESGTTGWSSSGGSFTTGTGYVVCGTKNGFNNANSNVLSKVYQDVTVPAGSAVTFSAYAGTHTAGQSCSPKLSLIFLNSSNAVISQTDVVVTRDVDVNGGLLEQYSISAVAPAGTVKARVQSAITCDWMKLDAFCLTAQAVGSIGDRVWNDINRNGTQDAGELGVAGVTVSLYDNSNNLVASTVTDAYGLYKFSKLPVSSSGTTYQVRFSLPSGYMFTTQNADAAGVSGANNSDANVTTGRTGNVTLTFAAPDVTYVDAGVMITQPNRIGDFVWNDLNKDGIQNAGEPGIAGVTVTLYDNAGNAIRTTITNNNGYYEFKDVPNGTYTIGISLPVGYQVSPQDQGGDDTKDSDLNPTTLKTASFVFSGGVNLTFDFGLNVTDPSKASVGDYVWIDLDNDNLQDANEPAVPNVTVQLYTSANVLVATTTTDAFGYYIFNNVTPGSYYVKFSNIPAGYNFVTADAGTSDYTDSDVNGANGAGTTATFTVLADFNYTQYDAGIRATTALNSLGDFVWYDLNKNGVQDAGEAGVPGITVTLYNASTGAIIKSTTTNSQGLYMFTDLAAGSYSVGFSNLPAGYAFTQTGAGTTATDSDPNPNTGRTGTITIAGTGNVITTVDAGIVSNPNVFDAKAALGDYVWNDLNNNGIQDAGEPGIPGVTVTLYGADGTTVLGTTTTDALGYYQFTNLNAGTYIVGFSGLPSGYVFGTKDAGTDDAKDSDADPVTGKTGAITLLPGQINTTVDAGARNPTTLAKLGDRVWNDVNGNGFQDAGEPGIPGVSVSLLNSAGTVIKNTVTDANGFYLFTDLAAGTYKVRFGNLPSGFVATTKDATPVNDATDSDADATTLTTDNITLAAGATDLTWDFGVKTTTLASVGDYVWSDTNGNGQQDAGEPGVAGVLVTLYNSAGVAVASTITDANGKYLFVNVTPGNYTIGFSGIPAGSSFTTKDSGADASDSDVNPATGRTDAFTLVAGQSDLTRDAGLVVRLAAVGNYTWFDLNSNGIQDATEPPAAGVTVTLYDSGNNPVGSAVTDGNGFYLINNIPVAAGGANYTIGFTDKPATTVFTTKNAAGSTVDNNSDANTATGLTDAFSLNPGQIRLDQDAGLIRLVNLSGNVWHDVNALDDNLVNNSGAAQTPPAPAIPTGLRAYLVNASTGLIERVVLVNSVTGTYAFFNITPNTNYFVYLSQQVASVGSVPPPTTLPAGWNHTGQKLGITAGSDGIPGDGRLGVPVFSTDVINANFGIRLNTGEVVIG